MSVLNFERFWACCCCCCVFSLNFLHLSSHKFGAACLTQNSCFVLTRHSLDLLLGQLLLGAHLQLACTLGFLLMQCLKLVHLSKQSPLSEAARGFHLGSLPKPGGKGAELTKVGDPQDCLRRCPPKSQARTQCGAKFWEKFVSGLFVPVFTPSTLKCAFDCGIGALATPSAAGKFF